MRFALINRQPYRPLRFLPCPRCDLALRHSVPPQGRLEAVLTVRCSDTEASDAALLESVVFSLSYLLCLFSENDFSVAVLRVKLSPLVRVRTVNDNLEAQTQALFDELFLRDGMPDCTLSEIANVNPTRTLSKGCIAKCYDMSCLPTRGCVPEGGEIKAYNGGVRFQNGDTLIARITPCLENGKAAYINILNDKEVAFGSTEYIVFSPVDTMPSSFYYFLIRSKKFRTFALQYMNGSSGRQRVSGDELAAFPLTKPSHEALSRFDMVAKPVLEQFKVASLEINRLNALQQLIIASISSR